MKIKWFALLLPFVCFAQSSDFTQNFGAVPPINRGQIVKMSSTGQVVPMLTTDISGAMGIATTSTTSSNVLVTLFGAPLVAVDGSCTPGNVVLISTTAAGQGHCASAAANQVIGIATTTASNGFATVQLAPLSSAGASGVAPNNPLPASSSGPGPVFNVKNYGAAGNTQISLNGTAAGAGLTCTDCAFTPADVGKNISCALSQTTNVAANTTILSVTNATTVVLSQTAAANGSCRVVWGKNDDAAVATATTAALAQGHIVNGQQSIGISTASPCLYFPAGVYYLTAQISIISSSTTGGFCVLGDGMNISKLVWNTGTTTARGALWISSNNTNVRLENFSMDGVQGADSFGFGGAIIFDGSGVVHNVSVENFQGHGIVQGGTVYYNRLSAQSNTGAGLLCNACSGEAYESGLGNSSGTYNLIIQNSFGSNGQQGFSWFKGLIDECGTGVGGRCTHVINSVDVWLSGDFFEGIDVDGTSFIHLNSGLISPFGGDPNSNGLVIAAGGIVQSSDFRFVSSGTGKCINNSGILYDNGGNTCENMFTISSGTSTGTTAVLTLAGGTVNANCSVGDALLVVNPTISGYAGYYPAGATSGITAVTATTLTYTTPGSNLGALGAGGTAYCRNLQSYTGTLPKALLNNPIPNTCYITGTFAATTTAAPMCAFKLGSATNVNQIKATSTTTTACTVAPVVTITDGTVSETLTITTAKSIWDSSVDASTGVGTSIFKPNGTITLSNTAGTCTTPPTNFSVSYNISPILSN